MNNIKQSQFIDTNKDLKHLSLELISWSESSWWPKDILMSIKIVSSKENLVIYRYAVKLPFAPSWQARKSLEDRDKGYLRRDFLDGLFRGGFEEVSLERKEKGFEMIYNFCYEINNFIDKFFWDWGFKYLHKKNIDKVLNSFKNYIEQT